MRFEISTEMAVVLSVRKTVGDIRTEPVNKFVMVTGVSGLVQSVLGVILLGAVEWNFKPRAEDPRRNDVAEQIFIGNWEPHLETMELEKSPVVLISRKTLLGRDLRDTAVKELDGLLKDIEVRS